MLSRTYLRLKPLRAKLYFTVGDVAQVLGIKRQSARLECFRFVREGLFIRLKNDMYVFEEKWQNFSQNDYFQIASYLQVPAYISFISALSFYGITTQVQQQFFESSCFKRTRVFEQGGVRFNYYKIKKELYFGFVRKGSFFIATAEKAFLDVVYLYSFGKYKFDSSALDLSKLNTKMLRKMLIKYPLKTRKIVGRLCKI